MPQASPNSPQQSIAITTNDPYAAYGGRSATQSINANPYASYGGAVAHSDPYAAYGGKTAVAAVPQKVDTTLPKDPFASPIQLTDAQGYIAGKSFASTSLGPALQKAIATPANKRPLTLTDRIGGLLGVTPPPEYARPNPITSESPELNQYLNQQIGQQAIQDYSSQLQNWERREGVKAGITGAMFALPGGEAISAGAETTVKGLLPKLGGALERAIIPAGLGLGASSATQVALQENPFSQESLKQDLATAAGFAGGHIALGEIAAPVLGKTLAKFFPKVPAEMGGATPTDPLSLQRNPPDWRRYGAQAGEASQQMTNEIRRNPPNWQRIAQVQEMPERASRAPAQTPVAPESPIQFSKDSMGITWAKDPALSPNPVSIPDDIAPDQRVAYATEKLTQQGQMAADLKARLTTPAAPVAEAQLSGTPSAVAATPDLRVPLAEATPANPSYIYRVRNVEHPEMDLNGHAHATSSLERAQMYADNLANDKGQPFEVVRINTKNLKLGRDVRVAESEAGQTGAGGATWFKFMRQLRPTEGERVSLHQPEGFEPQAAPAYMPAPVEVPDKLPQEIEQNLSKGNLQQAQARAVAMGVKLGRAGAEEFGTKLEEQAAEAEAQASKIADMHSKHQANAPVAEAIREAHKATGEAPQYDEQGNYLGRAEGISNAQRAMNHQLLGDKTKEVFDEVELERRAKLRDEGKNPDEVSPTKAETQAEAKAKLAELQTQFKAKLAEVQKRPDVAKGDAMRIAMYETHPEFPAEVKRLQEIAGRAPTKTVYAGKVGMTEGNTAPLATLTTKDLQNIGVRKIEDIPAKAQKLRARAQQLRDLAQHVRNGGSFFKEEEPPTKSLGSAAAGSEAQTRQSINEAALGQALNPESVQTKPALDIAMDAAESVMVRDPEILKQAQVRSNEMTKQLADELGYDQKAVQELKGETFNDIQQYAAVKVMNDSANSVLDAAAQVRAGRMSPDEYARRAAQYFGVRDAVENKLGRAAGRELHARRAAKESVVNLPGDRDPISGKRLTFQQRLSRFALQLIGQTPKEERAGLAREFASVDQNNPTAISRFIHKISPTTTSSKLYEAWQSGLLNGGALPKKLVGDFTMTLKAPLEKLLGGDPKGAAWNIIGALQGGADAIDAAAQTFQTEIDPNADEFTSPTVAIKGKTGRIIRLPRRAIAAVTSFFHTINASASIAEQAAKIARKEGRLSEQFSQRVADLRANPTDAMRLKAADYAAKQTFSNMGALAKIATHLRRMPYVGKVVFPFAKTPANIAEEAFNVSPFGLAKALVQRDILKKPVEPQMIGKGVLGTSLALWALYKAKQGLITGGGTNFTPAQREAHEAAGWQPYSVKIGNHYVSMRYWEPIAPSLMAAADAAEAKRYDSPEVLQNLFAATRDTAETLPFMYTVTNLASAMQNPNMAGRFLGKEIGSVVPTGVADIANLVDTRVRTPKSFGQEIENRIPGMTGQVPAMIGPNGEPMQRPASGLGGFNPYPATSQSTDKVTNEFASLGESVERPPAKASPPRHGLPKGARVPSDRLSLDEASQLQQQDTKMFYNALTKVMSDPRWDSLPDAMKRRAMAEIRRRVDASRYGRLMQLRKGSSAHK